MALKIMDESREAAPDATETFDHLKKALDYAIFNGARISSHSYGFPNCQKDSSLSSMFSTYLLKAPKHILVAAAGNYQNCNDDKPSCPCNTDAPNSLCVAASNKENKIWFFSNYGRESVHVFAPGGNITSLWIDGNENVYADDSGTSMAAPHVAGLAALILSINRDLTGERVKKYILDNVQTFDQYSDYVSSGGLIDVGKTLKDLSMPLIVKNCNTCLVVFGLKFAV